MIALGKETELLSIREVDIHGLGRAEQAAAFSMQADVGLLGKVSEQDVSRGKRLGNTKSGGGEDKFLRFITVEFTVTAPRYWCQELMTYHHLEMNSQSTMHRITNMDIEKACNPYVDTVVIENLQKLIDSYKVADEGDKRELFKCIKANIPEGLMLTARVVTNYAQLKTIYRQRSKHRLEKAILQARNLILKALQDFGYNLDFSDTTSEYLDDETMVDLSKGYAYIYSDYDREIISVERRLIGGKVE